MCVATKGMNGTLSSDTHDIITTWIANIFFFCGILSFVSVYLVANDLCICRYSHRIINDEVIMCVICLENLNVGVEATQLHCMHAFHPDCITKWAEISNECPICRTRHTYSLILM